MAQPHKIWNLDIGTQIREEELDGRHYVVVPMTMILEGVHTGSQGAVYYSIDELAKTPKMWNFKPVLLEHPFRGDTATDLEVYKKQSVGMIMNTHFIDGKLKAEAWVDKEKAQAKCPEILEHIQHKLPMEVSTGLFSELVLDDGVWQGEPYAGRIINIRADHLAILPKKQGACSLADGAGLLINQKKEMPDTLNIITTVVNQEYVAGSLVTDDDDTKEEEPNDNDAEIREKPQEKVEAKKDDRPIENPLQKQIFTTADGYKITVEPPQNKVLDIPEPDFASGTNDESEKVQSLEEVPLRDNPTIVDDDQEIGETEFVELLHNVCNAAEKWQTALNAVLRRDVGKHGGRRFAEDADGKVYEQGRPKGATTSEENRAQQERRKKIRESLVQLQQPLMQLKEKLYKEFPGYSFPELEKVIKAGGSNKIDLTPQQASSLQVLLDDIEHFEALIKEKTDEYWDDFDRNGPTRVDPDHNPDNTPDRVHDEMFVGGQLELKDLLQALKTEYARFKEGKPAYKHSVFQFATDTTDADIAQMEEELRREADSTEGADVVGEAFRQVQSLLQGMRRVPEDKKRQYVIGLIAVMDRFPVLRQFPELVKLAKSAVAQEPDDFNE